MTEFIALLSTALQIWNHKEKNKYFEEFRKLERIHREEYSKPRGERSDAVLDNVEHELRILGSRFNTLAREQNTTDQS